MDLAKKKCEACEGGVTPLKGSDLEDFKKQIDNGWKVVKDHELQHDYKFADFAEALAFVNKVGAIAEDEGHHPDVELGWGKVKITLTTHAIDGLSINDFIVAAKIDKIEKS
jgi:4a-hydroxytetrahydrobiopterin dehydratase